MKKRISLKELLNSDLDLSYYQEALSAYGFANPKAVVGSVREMVKDTSSFEYFSAFFPTLFEELSKAPDPDMALINFDRFASAVSSRIAFYSALSKTPNNLRILIKLFGTSQYLSDALIRNPEYFDLLINQNLLTIVKDNNIIKEEMRETVFVFDTVESRMNALRRFKRREMLRIGIKDIVGISRLEETVIELSGLADAVLTAAYLIAKDDLEKKFGMPKAENKLDASFSVISLGKLGGEELNYSSDIDVIFIYSEEGKTDVAGIPRARSVTNNEFFTKMGEMIVNIIGSSTKEGYVFRIDTRLRPEGKSGPLVRSLDSYEDYYTSAGEAWERMALIKARFSAGDEALGNMFIGMIRPFVFQKYLTHSAIDEIKEIKRRIDKEVVKKGQTFSEVKLGYGGIREIEFAVQITQLIYGGKDEKIRSNNTLRVIQALSGAGIFEIDEAIRLIEAYRFLRKLEHFLQIEHALQLHNLPTDPAELDKLAKKLGYAGGEKGDAGRRLIGDYKSYAEFVHVFHNKVFAGGKDGESAETDFESNEFLTGIGFKDINKAQSDIRLLVKGPDYMHITPATARIFKNFAGDLFRFLKSSADPDMAFNNFERFVSSQGARSVFYKMLDENRQLIKLLVELGANSQFLSDIIVANPDLLSQVLMSGDLDVSKESGVYCDEIKERIKGETDLGEALNQIRIYKKGEIVRIGLRDILNISDLSQTLFELSNLADAILKTAFEILQKIIVKEYGKPADPRFAIFGMGKLGGAELGYSSDLDIIFAYSGEGRTSGKKSITNQEFYAKLSEKIISALSAATQEGFLYRVDTRIRPGGKSDVIILSMDGYRNYYGTRSMTWEKQALTKARFICGDEQLKKEFSKLVNDYLYKKPLTAAEVEEIRNMRGRMETERVKEGERGVHIKLSAGGIVDVEFIAQVGQLLRGSDDPDLRKTGTLDVLKRLRDRKYLNETDFVTLHDGYIFLRKIENKLRIVSDLSLDALPKDEQKLAVLVKRLGEAGAAENDVEEFLEKFRSYTKNIRDVFNRTFNHTS